MSVTLPTTSHCPMRQLDMLRIASYILNHAQTSAKVLDFRSIKPAKILAIIYTQMVSLKPFFMAE